MVPSEPLKFPMGVRTALTITASFIFTCSPSFF
jgi:hypothetical protein